MASTPTQRPPNKRARRDAAGDVDGLRGQCPMCGTCSLVEPSMRKHEVEACRRQAISANQCCFRCPVQGCTFECKYRHLLFDHLTAKGSYKSPCTLQFDSWGRTLPEEAEAFTKFTYWSRPDGAVIRYAGHISIDESSIESLPTTGRSEQAQIVQTTDQAGPNRDPNVVKVRLLDESRKIHSSPLQFHEADRVGDITSVFELQRVVAGFLADRDGYCAALDRIQQACTDQELRMVKIAFTQGLSLTAAATLLPKETSKPNSPGSIRRFTKEVLRGAEMHFAAGATFSEVFARLDQRNGVVRMARQCGLDTMENSPRNLALVRKIVREHAGRSFGLLFEFEYNLDHLTSTSFGLRFNTIWTQCFRDPVLCVLGHMKSYHSRLSRFTKFASSSTNGTLPEPPEFVHDYFETSGYRSDTMEIRQMAQNVYNDLSESERANWRCSPGDLFALPLSLYIDDCQLSSKMSFAPVVTTSLLYNSEFLRRDESKIVVSFANDPEPDGGGSGTAKGLLSWSCRQELVHSFTEIVSAHQREALRIGGIELSCRGKRIYVVPVLAEIIGDTKELNRVLGVKESQACRICHADQANGYSNDSPPRDLKVLQSIYRNLKDSSTTEPDFRACAKQLEELNMKRLRTRQFKIAILSTSMRWFGRCFSRANFDTLHTLPLGVIRDALRMCLALFGENGVRRVGRIDYLECSNHTTEHLAFATFMNNQQPSEQCSLESPMEGKSYPVVGRGLISAFILDLVTGSHTQMVPLCRRYFGLLWVILHACNLHYGLRQRVFSADLMRFELSEYEAIDKVFSRIRTFFGMIARTPKLHGLKHLILGQLESGPAFYTDTDHYESHHKSMKPSLRQLKQQEGKLGVVQLHREIEMDAIRAIDASHCHSPSTSPFRIQNGENGHLEASEESLESIVEIICEAWQKYVRSENFDESIGLFASTTLLARLRAHFAGCKVDRFVLSTKAVISDDTQHPLVCMLRGFVQEEFVAPSFVINLQMQLFLPVFILQGISGTRAVRTVTGCINVVSEDELHARISQVRYHGESFLDGFRVADLRNSIAQAENKPFVLQELVELRTLASYRSFKSSCSVVWPLGSQAFMEWKGSPFPRIQGPPTSTNAMIDCTEEDEELFEREAREQREMPAPASDEGT